MNHRRTELEIAVTILSAIREWEDSPDGEPRKTRLQARAYLNWNALSRHLEGLRARELLIRDGLRLTERGRRFLQMYRGELQSFLENYGF